MKKLFVFLTILITIFGFTSFVQAQVSSDSSHYDDEGATSKYEVEPTRVLITFNRELFDLRTESGEKEALQYINTLSWEDPFVAGNLKGEKSMIFIKDQNLAIVRIFPVDLDGEKSGVYIPIAKSVVSQIRKAYFQGKKVGEAQLNFKYRLLGQSQTPTFKPSDPYFKSQSNLFAKFYINDKSIGFSADEAWDFTERKVYEGRGVYKGKYTQDVVVAILDDGLTDSSYISPDISPILWKAKDDVCVDYNYKKIKCPFGGIDIRKYLDSDSSYNEKLSNGKHGEGMATLIAGQMENNFAIAGINNVKSFKEQYVRIMPIKIDKGYYGDNISSVEIVSGMHFAKNNLANLVNLSLEKVYTQGGDPAVAEAIRQAGQRGIFTITSDSWLCKVSEIDYRGQIVKPVVCAGGYDIFKSGKEDPMIKTNQGDDKLDKILNIKSGENVSCKALPKIIYGDQNFDVAAPIWATVLEDGNVIRPYGGLSYSVAHITGAMAHILRFGIASKNDMALQRCIIDNINDDILSFNTGGVVKTVNLAKMVQFSGKLSQCQEIAKKRVSRSAPKLEIKDVRVLKQYSDSIKNEFFDLAIDIIVPKDYAYEFEYILKINQKSDMEGTGSLFGRNSASMIFDNNKGGVFTVKATYYLPANNTPESPAHRRNFDTEYVCVDLFSREPSSLRVYTSQPWCRYGSQLLKKEDGMQIDVTLDQEYIKNVIDTSEENDDKLDINISGLRDAVYDVEVNVEKKFACPDQWAQMLNKSELAYLSRSFAPPTIRKFSKVKSSNGIWSESIKVSRLNLTPYDVVITVSSGNKIIKQIKKDIFPTEGFICMNGASIYPDQDKNIHVQLSGRFYIDRQGISKEKNSILSIWRLGGKLTDVAILGARAVFKGARLEKNLWKVTDYEILNLDPSRDYMFTLTFLLTPDEVKKFQDKVFLSGAGGDNSLLGFYNKDGVYITMPFYSGLPKINLKWFEDSSNDVNPAKKEVQLALPARIMQTISGLKLPSASDSNPKLMSKDKKDVAATGNDLKNPFVDSSEISIVSASSSLSGSIFKAATKSIKKNSAASQWFEISNNSEQGSNAKVSALFSSDKNFFFWSDAIYLPQNSPYCITAGIKDKFGKIFRSAPYCFGGMSAIDNTR